MAIQELQSIEEISDLFEVFIFDIWGTIYDGQALFPGVKNVLRSLRQKGKCIIFLSNSPQIENVLYERLNTLGIDRGLFDEVVTSGGEAKRQLSKGQQSKKMQFDGPVYLTGPNRYPNVIPEENFLIETALDKSKWILNAGPDKAEETLDDYIKILQRAKSLSIPMLCTNPDKIVLHGNATHICAGYLAAYYSSIGGAVSYIGKPYPAVFERCKSLSGKMDTSRYLMIGDNLETDIRGANSIKFSSLLLGTGVHKITDKSGCNLDLSAIQSFQNKLSSFADYAMTSLR